MNPLKRFYKWIHYKLFIESDDPNAPDGIKSKRRVVNNTFIIQLVAVSTIVIGLLLSIFILVYLATIPYFVLGYFILATAAGVVYLILTRREKKREKEMMSA